MKPFLEKINKPVDASWSMLNRRLQHGIPFQWHHHPELELTLTLNSRGLRFIGDQVGHTTMAISCYWARTCRTPGPRARQ